MLPYFYLSEVSMYVALSHSQYWLLLMTMIIFFTFLSYPSLRLHWNKNFSAIKHCHMFLLILLVESCVVHNIHMNSDSFSTKDNGISFDYSEKHIELLSTILASYIYPVHCDEKSTHDSTLQMICNLIK